MRIQRLGLAPLFVLCVFGQGVEAAQAPSLPSDERVLSYVTNSWSVYSDIDKLTRALDEPVPGASGLSLKTKIGLFILALDIADKARREDYAGAVRSGLAWSVPAAISYAGFPWLAAAASFGSKVYKFGQWLVDNFDRIGLNAQFQYYFYYRDDGCSHEDLLADGCGMGLRDGWLLKPIGYQSGVPSRQGRIQPAQFYEMARSLYDTARLDHERKNEEKLLRRELQDALARVDKGMSDMPDVDSEAQGREVTLPAGATSLRKLDFLNFTYDLSDTACGDAVEKFAGTRTVTLQWGRYSAPRSRLRPEFEVAVASDAVSYIDVDGDGNEEAIVMLFCGHALRNWGLPVVFRRDGVRAKVMAYLDESHRSLGGPASAHVAMSGKDLVVSYHWKKRMFSESYEETFVYRWQGGALKRAH